MSAERNPHTPPKDVNRATIVDCDTLRLHADELAELYPDIEVRWGDISRGAAYGRANQVTGVIRMQAPCIRNADDYATLVHEYGHLLGPWQSKRGVRYSKPKSGRMVEECGAWVWGMENAVAWTPKMERHVQRHLGYLARRAARKSWRGNRFVVPGARHVFWKLAGEPRKAFHFNEQNVRRP